MRQSFNVTRDSAGNVPPLSAIFPDQMAPVIRNHEGERELIRMRWGFPPGDVTLNEYSRWAAVEVGFCTAQVVDFPQRKLFA